MGLRDGHGRDRVAPPEPLRRGWPWVGRGAWPRCRASGLSAPYPGCMDRAPEPSRPARPAPLCGPAGTRSLGARALHRAPVGGATRADPGRGAPALAWPPCPPTGGGRRPRWACRPGDAPRGGGAFASTGAAAHPDRWRGARARSRGRGRPRAAGASPGGRLPAGRRRGDRRGCGAGQRRWPQRRARQARAWWLRWRGWPRRKRTTGGRGWPPR